MPDPRPHNSEALADACEKYARGNYGYLHVTTAKNRLQKYYEDDERVSKFTSANTVDRSDIVTTLESLTDRDSWQELRQKESYYYSPFRTPEGQTEHIDQILDQVFTTKPYATKNEFFTQFKGTEIPDSDQEPIINELCEFQRIDEDFYRQVGYLKPGTRIRQQYDAPSFEIIERNASGGKLSHKELESTLSLNVGSQVVADLKREGVIFNLDEHYLVNTDTALEDYANDLVDPDFRSKVRKAFGKSDGVRKKGSFNDLVQREIEDRSPVLDHVSDPNQVIAAVRRTLKRGLGLETDKIENNQGIDVVFIKTEEFHQKIVDEATSIADELEDDIGEREWLSPSRTRDNQIEPKVEEEVLVETNSPVTEQYLKSAIVDRTLEELLERPTNPLKR